MKTLRTGLYLLAIAMVFATCKTTSVVSFDAKNIEKSMVAALKWQEANPIQVDKPVDWTHGAYYTGVAKAHEATQNPVFLQAIKDKGMKNDWSTWKRFYHADDVAISYSYLYFNEQEPNVIDIKPTAKFISDHFNKPHEWKEGTDPKGEKVILWWWCDALFMAPPVIAKYAKLTGEKELLETSYKYYKETYDLLFNKEEKLFARDTRFVWDNDNEDLKEKNGKKIFWSRGNGWVIGGLALLLDELPKDAPHRAFYEELYLTMAAKIKEIQPKDGLWRTSLLDPDSWDHGEVSGSGFYTFALAWGVNNGMLNKADYEPAVRKAWSSLMACQQESGKVGWVQDIGAAPKPATKDSWQNFGTGAFLLAGSEIMKMK